MIKIKNAIFIALILSLFTGCKGGGKQIFDTDGNRVDTDGKTDDTDRKINDTGDKVIGTIWSKIEFELKSSPSIGSIIEPKVNLIDHEGNAFPIDARYIDWEISEPTVASYNKTYQSLVFQKLGKTSISAKYYELNSIPIDVQVEPINLVSIELISYATPVDLAFSPNMKKAGGRNFYVVAHYNNGRYKDVTDSANWSVSDSSVIDLNPYYKGGIVAVGIGLADVIVEYQGYQQRLDIYVYDADVLNNPVSCGVSDIAVPVPEEHKDLIFRCPPLGQRNGDYNSTQIWGQPLGIINGILPYFTFQSADNYCNSIGYRLPTWKETLALRAAINSGVTYPFGPYLDYGWPQLQGYWLADPSPTPGQRYQGLFTAHSSYLQDETSWREVTALCVKDQFHLD